MSDSPEKKLVSSFVEAWSEAATPKLGQSSAFGLLALREVRGDDMDSALAVAVTWSSGFAVPCSGALPGIFISLFKGEDCDELEKLTRQDVDGKPKPGCRAIVNDTLNNVTTRLGSDAPEFGEVTWLDLSAEMAQLRKVTGDIAWIATCSLSFGDNMTQALLIYAPNGSLEVMKEKSATVPAAAPPPVASQPAAAAQPAPLRRTARQDAPRNIERLLEVELEVVVRFGATSMPLREILRMGIGTMLELDRAVEEPVELLINGRPLARGSVVVIDGYYGVRITEIGEPSQRPVTTN